MMIKKRCFQSGWLAATTALVLLSGSSQAMSLSQPLQGVASSFSATSLQPQARVPARLRPHSSVTTRRINRNDALRLQQLSRLPLGKSSGHAVSGKALLTSAQTDNLRALNRQSSVPLQVSFDSNSGTPTFIKTQLPAAQQRGLNGGWDYKAAAGDFLSQNRALLRLQDPAVELQLQKSSVDQQGNRHLLYQQRHQGVPLWGQQLALHLDSKANLYLLNGRYQPSLKLNTQATLRALEAEEAAKRALGVTQVHQISSELMVYTQTGTPLLVYKVDIQPSFSDRWLYFIDANSGAVVHKIHNIHHAVQPSSARDLLGQQRFFNSWLQNGSYLMADPTLLGQPLSAGYDPLAGPNATGDTFILTANNGTGSNLAFVSSQNANAWDATAVSAMANTQTVYNYYKDTFGRQSIDGKNKNLLVVVHLEQGLDNAFWNGTFMVYGDGGQIFQPLAKCLDVAAHEMTHGVIESSANLIYENQSGALNESFADVFAAMVDRGDWLAGEDCTLPAPGFLRSLQDPSQGLDPQPTKMSEYKNLPNTPQSDNGGVHVNSGIPNRAAYLLAEGLSAEGLGSSVGRVKAEQIYYRALTVYLTASAQFLDARRALIQASEDLYGVSGVEALAVGKAWDAVEVFDGATSSPNTPTGSAPPNSTDVVSGSDVMFYLYPAVDTLGNFTQNELFSQTMNNPFNGYQQANDRQLSTRAAFETRPASYTDSSGRYVFFVGSDNNLYAIDPVGGEQAITSTADMWSFAISPDGRYLAYTTTLSSDNQIHIVDFSTTPSTQRGYSIPLPSYQNGTQASIGLVHYADSLSFDYSGETVLFDFLACTSLPNNACLQGSPTDATGVVNGLNYWSVGFLDLSTSTSTVPDFSFPFPAQNPAVDLGYPTFAANNNRVITLDFIETLANKSRHSQTLVLDFETQNSELIYDHGESANPIWGHPSFWGDDRFITVNRPATTVASSSAIRVPIQAATSATPWRADPTQAQPLNSFGVTAPVMHRAGVRQLSGALALDRSLLGFGAVELGSQRSAVVQLNNQGNRDVQISNIILTGQGFSHNGTNLRLARGASISIQVTFTPLNAGAQVGTLTFESDGTPARLSLSLSGNGTLATTGSTGSTGSTSSGAVSGGELLLLFLLLLTAPLLRKQMPINQITKAVDE